MKLTKKYLQLLDKKKLFAFHVPLKTFLLFNQHGSQAGLLCILYFTLYGIQSKTKILLPVRDQPEFVRIGNYLSPLDSSNKSKTIHKLIKLKLFKQHPSSIAPGRAPVLRIPDNLLGNKDARQHKREARFNNSGKKFTIKGNTHNGK